MGQPLGLLYFIVFFSFLIFHCYIWVAQHYPVNSLSFLLAAALTFLGTCMHLTAALFGYSVRQQIFNETTAEKKELWFSRLNLGLILIIIADGIKNIIMTNSGSFLIWGIFDCFLVSILMIQLLEKFPKRLSVILLVLWILLKLTIFKMGFINSEEVLMDQFNYNKFKILISLKTFLLCFLLMFYVVKIFLRKSSFKHWPYCLILSSMWFFYEPSTLNLAVSQNYFTAIAIGDNLKQNTYPLLHWFPVILGAYLLPDLILKLNEIKYRVLLTVSSLLFIGLPFFSGNLAQGADFYGFMNVALRDHYNTLFFAQMSYLIVFLYLGKKLKFDNQISKIIAYGYVFNYFVLFFLGSSLARFLNEFIGGEYLFVVLILVTSAISILVGKLAAKVFSKRIEIKLVKSSG